MFCKTSKFFYSLYSLTYGVIVVETTLDISGATSEDNVETRRKETGIAPTSRS